MESDSAKPQWWQSRPKRMPKWLKICEADPSEPLEPWLVRDKLDSENGEPEPTLKMRVVKSVRIFASRDGWRNGTGCAICQWTMVNDTGPVRVKSDVCWQAPPYQPEGREERPGGQKILRTTITEYDRRAWGNDGGDFEWFCAGTPATHTGGEPAWRTYKSELIELIDERCYGILAEHCRAREAAGTAQAFGSSSYLLLAIHLVAHAVAEGLVLDEI